MYVWVPVCDGELIPQLLSTLPFESERLLVCGSPVSLGLPNQTGWKNPGTRLSLPLVPTPGLRLQSIYL